jgi:hypothetical protein
MSSMLPRLLLAFSVPLALWSCSQPAPATEPDPYANNQSYPWSQTTALTPQSLTSGVNTLQYETPFFARNSWGPVERNRSNGEQQAGDGQPLTLNGKVYAQGYGVHAGSELRFNLKGTNGAQCTRFTVDVGVDDEVGARGSVYFSVLVDKQLKYSSPLLTGSSPTQRIDVDITAAQELILLVDSARDGISYDHADWADPKIYCNDQAVPVQVSLDRTELTIFHKLSATLNATFSSIAKVTGPLALRLEQTAGGGLPLELLTTSVPFTGSGSATYPLTISAPNGLSEEGKDLVAPYRLIASSGGQDVASALVTISVKSLNVQARFEPTAVSGRDGEIKSVTVVLTITPPLPATVPLGLTFYPTLSRTGDFVEILSLGPTQGDGGTMRAEARLRFFNTPDLPDHRTLDNATMQVSFGEGEDTISGYRTPGYVGKMRPTLSLQLLR